jgi:fructokinase
MSGRACIFGEVLFDHFPDGRRVLGGAPFNVAWHLQAFGERPLLVSRVGGDAQGADVRAAMQEWRMDLSCLQVDDRLPTGRVQVRISDGEPSYEIVHPAAWDAIEAPLAMPPISLLYHGSLALRDEASRLGWRSLRDSQPQLVFVDVNLRPPWWNRESVLRVISGAHWVKLNRDELEQLAPGEASVRSRSESLLEGMGLHGLLLTDGARGARLLTAAGDYLETRPACGIVVADTVGAGDALAAVMLLGLARGWPLEVSLERAQDFASALVGQRGATVQDPEFYAPFLKQWTAR